MVTTSLRRLAFPLCAALLGGCDLFTDPGDVRGSRDPFDDRATTAGTPAGWSAWKALAERELVPLAGAAESGGHAATLSVEIGARRTEYRAVVVEKVIVP